MSYYTTDVYEIKKRNSKLLHQNIENLPKPTSNFVLDMQVRMARRAFRADH